MKRLCVLGSTGSIGTQTLDVAASFPEKFKIIGLSAGSNVELVEKQARQFKPAAVCVSKEEDAKTLRAKLPGIEVMHGEDGLRALATMDGCDTVVTAIVGAAGLKPTVAAIKAKKNVALANKETLVAGGSVVMPLVKKEGVTLMPIDSEHSAIFQCLHGEDARRISRIIITASGGSFRDWTPEQMERATPEQALKHPNWLMGGKITIDSATLMNKGLEVIEAHWLYDVPYEKIEAVIHPQSVIHSLVEFEDTSVMAQLGLPDMRLPIQYALSYPERLPNPLLKRLNLAEVATLTFKKIDEARFPCFRIALDAGKAGGTVPAAMNAANEIAVFAFLQKKIGFMDIPRTVLKVVAAHRAVASPSLEEILAADAWARKEAENHVSKA
ncbi:1-deoxy-D-xylulose-5-phosphate reductoisomerase [Candidatus Micrarchaeota archaeon CG10_big_fil_rev_8_21_14_0_10_59_7]|nr:MAG: 1-deoxy-D-xylulose-5-phosphate reductoisomerase [Candidatus Micrarchaeota archaeon CG10_big_fil_rev_8_21_14_0_10_59_7]